MINNSQVNELASYLNLKATDIKKSFRDIKKSSSLVLWVSNTNLDWQQNVKVQTKSQVEKWFKNTSQYLFELSEVHSFPARKKLTSFIVKFCKKNNLTRIADFGGGIGEDAIALATAGFTTTLAELDSKTFDFAKWRIKNRGLSVKLITVWNNEPFKIKYDAIVCLEVLQHLTSPLSVAKHFYRHLRDGGFLITTTHFNNPKYKMALKQNYHLEKTFEKDLEKIGFRPYTKKYLWGKSKTKKMLYIYQK